jgi:hypothetical protein
MTRVGSITFVRENERDVALIKPSDRRAMIVAGILVLVPVLSAIVSPERDIPLVAKIACGGIAVVVFAWQLFGLTRVEAGAANVVVRKSVMGATFSTRSLALASITFVQLEEQQMKGKGGTYVTYFVTFGGELGSPVRLPVEAADGAALVAMLERARVTL